MKAAITTASLMVAGAIVAEGALVTFSFAGANGNEGSYPPDAQPSGALVSDMTRGSGLTASEATGAFGASRWTTATTRDANDYFSFTITPQSGYALTLTHVELDERRSLTGIREWAIYSSLDNFTTALGTFLVSDDENWRSDQGVDLDSPFQSLTSALEFRFYGYNAEGTLGTWRIDNVELYGGISPVPEPAAWGGGSAVALMGFYGWRWWRQTRSIRASRR